MSELKITGNPNPVVGKEELYSVNQLLPSPLPFQNLSNAVENPFEKPVDWSMHVLENGRWIKKEENNKRGNKVSYKFIQKSLERKGIRILAKRGEETARLDVKPHNAESPKIDSIEFLDKNGNKPTKPFAYGQTLKARVHCLHMERRTVYATLWEDNDKSKENNKIETRFGTVIGGVVDIDFTLRPSGAHPGLNKDKSHKYYVTTVVNNKNMPSNPVNVKELEPPVPPFKKKNPIQQPNTPTAPVATKNGVSNVYITDINGQPIQGTYKSKKLKVWIESKGLQGKEIKLAIYDEDVTTNDLIYHNNFKISKDLYGIEVHLDKLPISKAGRLEGDIELFVDIEVLQNQTHTKSGVVNVDAIAFKQDSGAIVNTVLKVFDPSGEEKKNNTSCGEKYCIKKGDKSELIREINIRLAGFGGNVPTDEFTDRTEKMIKQFQRDYMKVPETGKVCGNVLKAVDEFSTKFDISTTLWNQIKCSCSTKGQQVTSKLRVINELNNCKDWGDGTGKGTYKTGSEEKNHKYEYPGIHRSLLFGFKAMLFYISKQNTYKFRMFSSGYRCRFKNYMTTNHQGKALDIQFSKDSWNIAGAERRNLVELRKIRDDIFHKYLNAKTSWINGSNNFCLEPIDLIYKANGEIDKNYTYSWIHFDVREFESKYLDDKYFCKNSVSLNGKKIIQLAKDLGFANTCKCINPFESELSQSNASSDRVDPKTLRTSKKGIAFIKDWEGKHMSGLKHIPYNDSKHFCTIGYGHLIAKNKCQNITVPEEFKNGITEDEALKYFNDRLIGFEKAIQRDIKSKLYQYEFDALVSLVFNTGGEFLNTGGANDGETQIKKKINTEEYSAGADEMSDVTNGGTPGLVKRRKAEINMFKNNIYDSTH